MPSTLICQEMNWSDALPTLHLDLAPVPPWLRGVRGDRTLPGWWAVPTQADGKEINLTQALPTLHLDLAPVPPLLRGVRGDLILPGWWAVLLPGWWAVLTQVYGKLMNITPALPTLHLDLVPVPPLLRGVRGDLILPMNPAVLLPSVVGSAKPSLGQANESNSSTAHPTSRSGSGSPLVKGG
ncbi:MAG: hypothetical protein F6K55_23245 [Moorea sp. SIO4A3]|nr:hypothetical protein [Moorena sp. SIO4A3]